MRIALLIQGSPSDSDACDHALSFARAVVRSKNTLFRVFFYKDAVRIADDSSKLSERARTRKQAWLRFATESQIELQVCVGASERRGISSSTEGESSGVDFAIVGLGQFVESAIECERLVTFN